MLSTASVLPDFAENTPPWYAIRLARAVLAVAVVLLWAGWRKIEWQDIGLGMQHFLRNFAIGFASVVALWLAVVAVRGTPLFVPDPISYEVRALAVVTALVDVLAQQLPTFGLIQGFAFRGSNPLLGFVVAWSSFVLAHLIGSPVSVVYLAAAIGLLFGGLMWRTRTLAAGLGLHFAFYFMLAIVGLGA